MSSKLKHIGWRVVTGDPSFWSSRFIRFHEFELASCPLDEQGNWKEDHPYHFQFNHKNFIVKEMNKLFIEDND